MLFLTHFWKWYRELSKASLKKQYENLFEILFEETKKTNLLVTGKTPYVNDDEIWEWMEPLIT